MMKIINTFISVFVLCHFTRIEEEVMHLGERFCKKSKIISPWAHHNKDTGGMARIASWNSHFCPKCPRTLAEINSASF